MAKGKGNSNFPIKENNSSRAFRGALNWWTEGGGMKKLGKKGVKGERLILFKGNPLAVKTNGDKKGESGRTIRKSSGKAITRNQIRVSHRNSNKTHSPRVAKKTVNKSFKRHKVSFLLQASD